jgi:hypothetical protein
VRRAAKNLQNSRRERRRRLHLAFVLCHVPVLAEFAANLMLGPDVAEAHRDMQSDGRFVRKRDSGIGTVNIFAPERVE